ncbi:basic leucine zipper 43-like [Mangifera indica]|uniref:basic leucine zipper 43-like n=1 Tax=Mangifera indica TaxID=29780 RepID=UPI001CFC3393|nr:basic leucine zipper 43-like [Mangifera indica]
MEAMEPHELKQQYAENPVQNLLHLSSAYPGVSTDFSSKFFANSADDQFHVPFDVFSPKSTSVSIGSTLDNEARENSVNIINERRLKRVISNRESARRSRMRKKKLIEELQFQVNQVQTVNHQLSEKIILLLENNNLILQENLQLKEKVASLQILLSHLMTPLQGHKEAIAPTANMNSLIAEDSS